MPLSLTHDSIVAGKYRLDRLIGKGGMGEVWAASHTLTRQRVAIKFLGGDTQKNDDARRRFFREARAACAVQHPNVVVIHDVIEAEEQTPAIVMELFQGESLEAKLRREIKLSVHDTLTLLLPVVSAVGTAHSLGIVHRDIKPDNIFLAETPEGICVKVLDFGVAKVGLNDDNGATAGGLTSTGAMLGTPYYMSPEQAFGEKLIDHRADLWSLGIVMYRCLSGQLPTQADNIGQILKIIMTRSIPRLGDVAPEVPAALSELVGHLLAYTPAERPADLRAVKLVFEEALRVKAEDFGPAVQAASSLAGVATPSLPRLAVQRRGRSPAVYALAGALLFGGATVFTLVSKSRPSSDPRVSAQIEETAEPSAVGSLVVASQTATAIGPPIVLPSPSEALSAASSIRIGKLPPTKTTSATALPMSTGAPAANSLGPIIKEPGY